MYIAYCIWLHYENGAERCSTPRVFVTDYYDRVTPLLQQLHWLRMEQRIEYKLALLVYRCFHGLAPSYLANMLQRVSALDSRRCLRSAATDTVVVPPTRLSTVGDRAFSVAAARAWNSLPSTALSAPSLEIFRQRLETELFSRSFMSPNIQTICKHSV